MEIKIYIDGKLDTKNELRKKIRKALWASYVYSDVLLRNKRLPITNEEKELVNDVIRAYSTGERRPF